MIYTRVSTKEQASNLSLETQRQACSHYCEQQGWEVVRVFEERGESAKTAERSEFQRMLSYCREQRGRVGYVVTYALSRFARDVTDHLVIRKALRSVGVELRSVTETIEETATGRFLETLLAAAAQLDNDQRSERTKAGMKAAVERGRWVWQAPVGYRSGGVGGIEPDPEMAPLVARAFREVASGRPAVEVLAVLNAEGFRGRDGRPVTPQTFSRVLSSPVYRGRVKASAWGMERPGAFPALVDEPTYWRVQEALGRGDEDRRHVVVHPDFPLRNWLLCGHCERPLTGAWCKGRSARYPYYWCRGHCERPTRSEQLEQRWIGHLEALRPSADYLDIFEVLVRQEWEAIHGEVRETQARLLNRSRTLRARRERLLETWLDGRVPADLYERQMAQIGDELAQAEAAAALAPSELDLEAVICETRALALHSARFWRDGSLELRRELQSVLFEDGVTYRGGILLNRSIPPFFNNFRSIDGGASGVASPTGASLNRHARYSAVLGRAIAEGLAA